MPSKNQVARKVAERVSRYGPCSICGATSCKHLAAKVAAKLASRPTAY